MGGEKITRLDQLPTEALVDLACLYVDLFYRKWKIARFDEMTEETKEEVLRYLRKIVERYNIDVREVLLDYYRWMAMRNPSYNYDVEAIEKGWRSEDSMLLDFLGIAYDYAREQAEYNCMSCYNVSVFDEVDDFWDNPCLPLMEEPDNIWFLVNMLRNCCSRSCFVGTRGLNPCTYYYY